MKSNENRFDAVLLWRERIGRDSATEGVVGRIKELCSIISQADQSLTYLEGVQKRGFLGKLLFKLETIKIEQRNIFRGQVSITYPTIPIDERTAMIKSLRQYIVRELGCLLMEKHPSQPIFLDQRQLNEMIIVPTWRSRWLVPGGLALIVGWYVKEMMLAIDWKHVLDVCSNVYVAGRNLFIDWISDPIKDIWYTIRYRNTSVALASATALKSDMDSLERMVVDFAKKHHPALSIAEVTDRVRNGDVTLILKKYEKEIQAPIKNVLMGDLVSMLLIQVQKSKVDLEAAMLAIDKLLKANELNFELLAVIPLLGILYGSFIGLQCVWRKMFSHHQIKSQSQSIRKHFHQLQKITINDGDEVEVIEARGETLLLIQSVLDTFARFPAKIHKEYYCDFIDDLMELLCQKRDDKRPIIDRMFYYYPFLCCCHN